MFEVAKNAMIHFLIVDDHAVVRAGLAALMRSERPGCRVSEAGDLMPQKSTYFYPKLATGLVINPLE